LTKTKKEANVKTKNKLKGGSPHEPGNQHPWPCWLPGPAAGCRGSVSFWFLRPRPGN